MDLMLVKKYKVKKKRKMIGMEQTIDFIQAKS